VIATFNWPGALGLLLESILVQDILPEEIVIADDGSDLSTKILIDAYRDRFSIAIKHFWQEHNGFQKSAILNRAIAGTSCNYIIQIDGDIVLHKHFIRDHIALAEKGCYIRGSRVMLSEKISNNFLAAGRFEKISPFSIGIRNRINALRIPLLSPLFIKKNKYSHNFRGCNCAFWKTDFISVNGYNNAFKGWGHEDIELAARFINTGIIQKKAKLVAVCYHLHHEIVDMQREPVNFKIYESTLNKGAKYCLSGYSSYQE
jgi:glycosyltransferase involved in cell wall biosynthesis